MGVLKNNFIVGLAAGLTATLIAPVLIPAIKKGSRPMAKTLVKGGVLVYQKGREMVAHSGEAIEDILAEVHAEEAEKRSGMMHAGRQQSGQAAQDGGRSNHLSTVKNGADATSRKSEDTTSS